jgi:hypothetical protein
VREVAVMCRASPAVFTSWTDTLPYRSLYNMDSVPETGEEVECCYPCARSIRFISVEGIGGSAEEGIQT